MYRLRTPALLSLVITIVMAVTPAAAQSEAVVQGRIMAVADRSALPGATVALTPAAGGEPVEAITDAGGHFLFTQVTPGQYQLSTAIDGFEPRAVSLTIAPREVRTVSLALDIVRFREEVRVTAVRGLPGTHSPSSTTLTRARIEEAPAFARTSLPDAIVTSAPGMIRGHDDFVHVRGEEVALNPLIEGIAFWENPHAMFSAGVSPDIVDTANVMTGAFPAEYGNRFGGVVDVATKSGLRMRERGSATVSVGDQGRRRGAADVGGRRGAFGYYLSASALESDRFLSPPDARAIHDTGRARHVFGRFDWSGARFGALNALVMADGVDAEIPQTPRDRELRPRARAEQEARQQTLTLGWTRAWSNGVVDASVYERRSQLRLFPAALPLTAQASVRRELQTVGGKAGVTRLSGAHTVKFGVDAVALRPEEELRYDYSGYRDLTHLLGLPHVHVADRQIAFSGRDSGGQVSAFAQDSMQLGDRITTDLGLRVDRYALVVTDTHISPRVNLAFRAGHGAVLHASFDHFFVPPPVEGVLSSSAGLTSAIREIGVGLRPLRPTTENQFEAGAVAPWGPVQLAASVYYRATANPVHTTVWPDSRIYSYASFDRGRAYGLEAKADVGGFSRLGLTGSVNYALGRVDFRNPVTGGFVIEAGHLAETNWFRAPMDQRHTLTADGTYRHARSGLWTGLSMEYGSGTPVGHGDGPHAHADSEADHADVTGSAAASRVPGHVTANASIGLEVLRDTNRRPRLTLRLDVENVANTVFVVARESEFSPGQYSIPRELSVTARVLF